jgi:hypothetical protein
VQSDAEGMTQDMTQTPERGARAARRWSRWGSGPGRSVRTMVDPQAEYAQRIAAVLNAGVLQDAVAQGLEDQGQFEVDVLDVLDALDCAHLKLATDEQGEVSQANAGLVASRRQNRA